MKWLRVPSSLRRTYAGYVIACVSIVVLSAILTPFREVLGLLNIGVMFFLLVLLVAAGWGWGPGLVASVLANLALNFFFVDPLYRFTVYEPENVIALLAFLCVAALASTMLARARSGEVAAQRRQQETALLYDLSRLIISEVDLHVVLSTICDRVRATFSSQSAAVMLLGVDGLNVASQSGQADPGISSIDERRTAEQAMSSGTVVALGGRPGRRNPRIVGITGRRAPVVYLPLRVGGRVLGVLRVVGQLQAQVFTTDELRLLQAFADEAALASDRLRLLHDAAKAEALQEADKLKTALLASVSHDLRTPLAAIKASATSLLQTDIAWDEETRREFLTAIDEETDRLTTLVSNLLDLSRIEGGALHPEKNWYDVRELIETVISRLGRSITNHRLVLQVSPDIGEAELDYVQIGQVLANLIENAAKFSPKGTSIKVVAQRSGADIEFSVSDEGPGIPRENRELVFDKFYRITRKGEQVPGTGLGLAISKGLVEAHGGKIYVTDAPLGGARFVFTIPTPLPEPVESAPKELV